MTRSTLTRKLFLRVAPLLVLTIAMFTGLAFVSATWEVDSIYDAQLINDTNVLWALLHRPLMRRLDRPAREIDDIDLSMDNQLAYNDQADDYADAHMFRIWMNSKIAFYSSTAFVSGITQLKAGFSMVEYQGEAWRVYSLPIPNTTISIEVGEKSQIRQTLVSNILLNLFFPLLLLVPLLGFLFWLGIKSALATVRGLVLQIQSRSPDDLSAIGIGQLPEDLAPLGQSLNQLLAKLAHSLTLERRFSDLAAHQLRTPQATVHLLVQMLENADSDSERAMIIADLRTSSNRASHLIEQLLHLARVSHHPLESRSLSLRDVTTSIFAEFRNVLGSRNIEISIESNGDAEVRTDEVLLRLILANLIENAVNFSEEAGKVDIVISLLGGFWSWTIADRGPGIPEDQREAVFQRFHRVERMQTAGAGLGLAIVAESALRLGIEIKLSTPMRGSGLLVTLLIPRA
jgi:two-component system sensor histidine kinase QseC